MGNKKNIYIIFSILFLCLLSFTGCNNRKQQKNDKTSFRTSRTEEFKGPIIGFSLDTLALERWQRDLDTFIGAASSLGAEVIVQNAANDSEEQNRQLLYLASQKVDCVVCLPRDSKSIKEGIERLHSQNIPIIAYDRLIMDSDIDLYMTIDSEKVGYLMGNKMRNQTQKTSWAIILGDPDDYNMTLIENGLWQALKNSNIDIIDTFYTVGWNYDLSKQHAFDLITSGIIPDAIICGNDAVADSVISVLDTHFIQKDIPICGQDADIAACQNIIKGKQSFTIYKPITELARQAAETAVKLATGISVQNIVNERNTIDNHYKKVPYIMLDPVYLDKENMKSVIIDSGFHSYNEVYQ